MFQLVTGNFAVTTVVHPRKRTDANQAPTNPLHVGGIMARSPASAGGNTENYVFVMAGSDEQAHPGVEVKSTTNGTSVWSEPAWSDPLAAELRLCRVGENFYTYKRTLGSSTWILANHQGQSAPIVRPDLPQTLQVGLALNFSGPSNDLNVAFDVVAVASTPPQASADCVLD